MSADRGRLVQGNLASAASMLCWATAFPVTELLLASWHPLLLAAARLGLAAGFALALLAVFGRPAELRIAPWRHVLPLGGLGLGLGVVLLVTGQAFADPVTVAIIATLVPLFSALMGAAAGDERLGPRLLLALALAVTGGLVATGVVGAAIQLRGGEVLALGSTLLWTWYSRASVSRLAMLSDLAKTTANMLAAAVAVVPVAVAAVALGLVPARLDLGLVAVGQLLWMGGVAVCLSMLLWLRAARLIGVTIAAMHQNLVPFYVMLMAVALGGRIEMAQIVGGALVVAGAALAQLPEDLLARRRAWR